jgi:hypothetical protein
MVDLRLRPLERCIRRSLARGVPPEEVARRFRRSPDWVMRVDGWAMLPRSGTGEAAGPLRPFERRVLRWRTLGAGHAEIATRFRRSGPFIEQVERLARYKLAR